ncbi:BLIP family beta-lactamase inhibitor [Streptomyces sp. NPDC006289]|uniref:BLIP family beta-lactamase inhibitor n=1 Tax=Streptomyces sp. NPDC006289 TaxID=3156744 RepID=UPI0033B3EDD1
MRLRRLVTAALLAAAMAGSTAATSSAAPKNDPDENFLTDTKYDAVAFGMSRQQVEAVIGTRPHCSGTGAGGALVCWAKNQMVDQTASFTFDAADQLFRKEKDYAFAYAWYTYDLPRTMTKAQYEQQFAVGDTLAEVDTVVAGTACTDRWVERPAHPSSSGWKTMIQCTGTVDESYPEIEFFFTDGVLTNKTYSSRDDAR